MKTIRRTRLFLGLHWKGFLWISLLLLALSGGFYAINYHYLTSQFHDQRKTEVMALRRQIDGLLTRTSDRLVRLSGALASMSDLGEALRLNDRQKLAEMITGARYASLGYELDVRRIELYTLESELVWHWTQSDSKTISDGWARNAVMQVRSEERPVTLLACRPLCLLYAFVPVLSQGENVGVMALGQSVADFIIEFRVLTNTDIALVMPAPLNVGTVLPQWNASITALTRADALTPFLKRLSLRYSGPSELRDGRIVAWQGADYDVHSIPLADIVPAQQGSIVLLSDVSAQLSGIREAVRQGMYVTATALALAELSLLYLVGVPIRRLERFARTLPLLAKGAYQQARERFSVRRDTAMLRDEIDVLYDSAITLSNQLEENTRALAAKNHELAVERDFIQGLLASAQVLVMTQTRYGVIRVVNDFAAQLTGYAPEYLSGRRFVELIGDDDAHDQISTQIEALCSNGQQRMEHEHELIRRDGERRQVVWVHTPLRAEHTDGTAVLSVGLDVTERVKAESHIRWLANHDPLTGLVNRHRFLEELTRALNEAMRTQTTAALLLFDLDHFKEINDISGHAAGDALLRSIADELRKRVRKSDVVARLGGDEFGLLMPQTDDYGAESFARKLNELVRSNPFPYGDKRYRIGVSIGIALLPHHGSDVQELMANADMAMYEAKRAGRSRAHLFAYEHEQGARLTQTVYWKDVLAWALNERQFFFDFQPVVDAVTSDTVYHEALLRLRMLDGRIVMPGEFLIHAQRAGLSYDLDVFVVDTALKALFSNPDRDLSINLSTAALSDPTWTEPLIHAVRERRLDPHRLIFEITETAVIADMEKARHIAEEVTGHGFRFAVDDFGAGFSSLYYLKQLPVSYVKIDRSLVKNLATSQGDRDFVGAITSMVHAYGKKVVGEGVEDAATLHLLRRLKVDLVQGYFIGRPGADTRKVNVG